MKIQKNTLYKSFALASILLIGLINSCAPAPVTTQKITDVRFS